MKNTKPFDLELAKAGHPLILSTGEMVSYVGISPFTPGKCIIVADRQKLVFVNPNVKDPQVTFHLLLDISIPWQAPLKQGDTIEVKINDEWKEALLVSHLPGGSILVLDTNECSINEYNEGDFTDNDDFTYRGKALWRRKPTEATIEITVKINGKDAKMSDISKETLLKIRENN